MKKLSSAVLCLIASVLLLSESAAFALAEGAEVISDAKRAFFGNHNGVSAAETVRCGEDEELVTLFVAGTTPSACDEDAAPRFDAAGIGTAAKSILRDGEETVTVRLMREEASETGGQQQGTGADDTRLAEAKTFIRSRLETMEETLDLQAYGLTKTELKEIYGAILNSTPDMFYVGNSYKLKLSAGKVVNVFPIYLYAAEEVPALRKVYEQKLTEILSLIDPGMTDLEKLMVLNDYFCLEYRYDNTYAVYDTLRFFTEKTGVCQAYMLALTAVLNRLGIPVSYAQSIEMNHIWNLVQLDGKWYHVDLTWNDPLDDRFGRALHTNFLKSDAGIAATGHYAWTTAQGIECTDTAYDNSFWNSVNSPFAYAENAFFYMDDGILYRVELQTQQKTELLVVPDRWTVPDRPGYTYSVSYSGIAAYDGCLFYTTPDAVMRYRLSTGQTERYYVPGLTSGQLFAFYGIGSEAHWLAASDAEIEQSLLATGSLQMTGAQGTEQTVLLTDSSAVTRYCPTVQDALAQMTDPDISYTLTPFLPEGRLDFSGIRELPAVSSVTLTGSGSTRMELDGELTLRSPLHLKGVAPVGTTEGSALLLQGYMLTVTAGAPMLAVRVTGDASSSLVILSSGGGEIGISAPCSVGTFVTEGAVRLGAACSAGVFRTEGDCRVFAEADFTCGTLTGTGSLTLDAVRQGEGNFPDLRITDEISVPVTLYLDPERKPGDAVLYAPKADAAGIAFRLKSDRYDPDLSPLFDKGEDGWFRYARETYLQIENGLLVSFVCAATQERVELPESVTRIGNYAFARCPEPENVFLPSGIEEIGAFGIGYSYDAAGKLFVSDKTVYEVAQDSVCEQYATENGLLYDSYLEDTVGDFTVRGYPVRQEAELLSYTGSDSEVILPSTLSLGGHVYADVLYAEGLFSDRQGLVIYCPVQRGTMPVFAVWEETHTLYCSEEWFMVTFTASGEVFDSYPALKGSTVRLPTATPASSVPDTQQYAYVFEAWDGYAEGMQVTGALTFRGRFSRITKKYTYTFYAEDGVTILKQETAGYGAEILSPLAPEKPPLADGTRMVFAGWSGYVAGMVLTKNVSFYAKYTAEGQISDEITALYYRIDRAFGFVRRIDAETKGGIFVGGFYDSAYLKLTTADGKEVPEHKIVGTGMKLSLVVAGEAKETLTLVVTGDLNGDGQLTLTDFVLLKSHLLGNRALSGAYREAADLTGDGEITLTDFIRYKSFLLGTSGIEPQ